LLAIAGYRCVKITSEAGREDGGRDPKLRIALPGQAPVG
jgi:hypothetical protein